MKKFVSLLMLSSIITISAAAMVSAATIQTQEERGFINVSTTANTEIMPDVAEINIAVQTFDSKSLQKATAENKEISDKVYKALSSMINKSNGDYVKTSNFSAEPLYKYNGNKKSLDKYQVSNNIIVHTKSIKEVGNIIDKAIALGATDVNDLAFSVSNYDKQCNELLSIAAQKATARAEIMAKATNSSLAGIKSMNGSCSTTENNRVQYRLFAKNAALGASMDSAAAPESSIPIQSGVIKIFANLNTSFFVK